MTDPHEPGWRPRYTGDNDLGDVGNGFGADLYELFIAGRVLFPQTALEYSTLTTQVHRMAGGMAEVLARAGYSEPADMLLQDLRAELQDALRRTCEHIDVAGQALVATAAAYAQTDDETADEFARLMDDDPQFRAWDQIGRREIPPPPSPDAPQPAAPELERHGRGGRL